jgi:drug/metabolite transporter (DMT)-like permease
VALFYGALLLDEEITAAAIAGLVLILSGVGLASRSRQPAPVPDCTPIAEERVTA